MKKTKHALWNKIKWPLLAGAPLFFFLRGIYLISTGGGWIATTDQPFHWILLFLEIILAIFTACLCFFFWHKESLVPQLSIGKRVLSMTAIVLFIIIIFAIHFIRVGFWIVNTV